MVFKLNIAESGKTWRLQLEDETLVGKSVGDVVLGKEISSDLEGYELMITGGSDNAGFPLAKNVEGIALKGLLLSKGWGMRDKREGMRLRKTVRGKVISPAVSQINLKVVKSGTKSLASIFPDQNKAPEVPAASAPAAA